MHRQPKLLVVEDEAPIAELISVNLRYNGYHVTWVADGAAAQREMNAQLPDLILLDWMLPGDNGITLAKRWRADARSQSVPIILLTARSDENDRVAGLDAGADDYISKPFSTKELLARVRAVLRRKTPEAADTTITLGDLSLATATYRVQYADRPLPLGPTDFKLLHYLMKHAERVHSRTQLLDRVWSDHVSIEERTVDVHIKRLRESMDNAAHMIETVRGAGYRITAIKR